MRPISFSSFTSNLALSLFESYPSREKKAKKGKGKKVLDSDSDDSDGEGAEKGKLPKIYIGTRTHKQISQMVKELKSTGYKPRISVLGSREQYCIHPQVSRSANKNDDCKELLDSSGCQFFQGMKGLQMSPEVRPGPQYELWDIEDLVQLGKKKRGCPYFASRDLAKHAEVIFCPYNYLIEYDTMGFGGDIQGNVLILDEAHNIEDFSRSAGSFEFTESQLADTEFNIVRAIKFKWLVEEHNKMWFLVQRLQDWMLDNSATLVKNEFEKRVKSWTGKDMKEVFETFGITSDNYLEYFNSLAKIMAEQEREKDNLPPPPVLMPTHCLDVMSKLCRILKSLFRPDRDYANDYRVVLVKKVKEEGKREWETTIGFWLMNPRVVFREISALAKCVVLTSGTLSPMDTFASELGVEFPLRLEAMHVIPDSSVWVGALGTGPDGGTLLGTFKNTDTLMYKDRVGNVVLDVVRTVPFGVLCFFTSYKTLEKMTERWKDTGVWGSMLEYKAIVVEPRGSEKAAFEGAMRKYYAAISASEQERRGKKTGALFFAVCRGKVSEGLDFTDNNARAVIAVGIPFPSAVDEEVEMKKSYNDQNAAKLKLLTGGSWYEIQAYRALNQALGRCIRHKDDWGAIILVDSRFCQDKAPRSLSKWVRARFTNHPKYADALASIAQFIAQKMETHAVNLAPPGPNRLLGEEAFQGENHDPKAALVRKLPFASGHPPPAAAAAGTKARVVLVNKAGPTLATLNSPLIEKKGLTPLTSASVVRRDAAAGGAHLSIVFEESDREFPGLPPLAASSEPPFQDEVAGLPPTTFIPGNLTLIDDAEERERALPPRSHVFSAPSEPTPVCAGDALSAISSTPAKTSPSTMFKVKTPPGKSAEERKRLLEEFPSPVTGDVTESLQQLHSRRKLTHEGPTLPVRINGHAHSSPPEMTADAEMVTNADMAAASPWSEKLTLSCVACGADLLSTQLSQLPTADGEGGEATSTSHTAKWIDRLPLETVRTSFGCTLREVCGGAGAGPGSSDASRRSFASSFAQFLSQGDSQQGLLDVSLFVFRNTSSLLASSFLTTRMASPGNLCDAAWSEGDAACFRPFYCSGCQSGTPTAPSHPVAVQVLAVKDPESHLSTQVDSLWVLPEMVFLLEAKPL